MKISSEQMQAMRRAPNSALDLIMPEFLFHSNKLEGSTFTEEELMKLVDTGIIVGSHTVNDVLETLNSIDVFKYIVDTLGMPVDDKMLCEMNRLLFRGTAEEADGFTGHYKTIPNRIRNSSVQVALPSDVPRAIPDLLGMWNSSSKDFAAIARFHARFEHIHPFQDGNGRIGRFLMLKQCIENDVDLIVVDEALEKPYKAWLEVAQTTDDFRFFEEILADCQDRFTEKMAAKGVDTLLPDVNVDFADLRVEMSEAHVVAPVMSSEPDVGLDKGGDER